MNGLETPLANTEATMQPEAMSAALSALGEKIVAQIRTVHDPEIPVNLYDLGLIYKIDLKPLENGKADVEVDMTLTTPNCPVAGTMPGMVAKAIEELDAVHDVKVNLVWEPVWDKSQMSDEAKLQLNMF